MGTHARPAKGYRGPVKKLIACFLIALASLNANAQARTFNQAELDALLAPVALYPDSLLDQILVAATYPHQVAEAAQWSQSNPRLSGDEAVRAAQPYGWHPSVTALTAFPDVLARMGASPQWVRELGEAWLNQEPYVLETVQQLRLRAEANGYLRSDEQQRVYRQGGTIVVQPVYSEVVFVRYYNPLIVFGPWWWHSHHPVYWHPWHARPVRWHWVNHHRPHHQRAAPVNVKPVNTLPRPSPAPRQHVRPSSNGSPSPAARMQAEQTARFIERQRQPIMNSVPQVRQMPAPTSYSPQRPAPRPQVQPRHQPRQAQQQRRDRRG
jgi:uncharacterized protein DUF3300